MSALAAHGGRARGGVHHASVLPLPPFEASAAAFLVSIVRFPFLAVLYHMGLTPLLRSGAKEERP